MCLDIAVNSSVASSSRWSRARWLRVCKREVGIVQSAAQNRTIERADRLCESVGDRAHLVHPEACRDTDVRSRCYLEPRTRLYGDTACSERYQSVLLVGYWKPDAQRILARNRYPSFCERVRQCASPLRVSFLRDSDLMQRLRIGDRVQPLVPRELVYEIPERMASDGRVRKEIDLDAVKRAAVQAKEAGVEGIAVAFLHSFRNPAHELAARDAIVAATGIQNVSISSDIWPKIGEYERAIAAVLNTYVKPRMTAYIAEIERWLGERLPDAKLFIMQSNGGALAAAEARAMPVHTLLSGPASGVSAAQYLGVSLDERCMLTRIWAVPAPIYRSFRMANRPSPEMRKSATFR